MPDSPVIRQAIEDAELFERMSVQQRQILLREVGYEADSRAMYGFKERRVSL